MHAHRAPGSSHLALPRFSPAEAHNGLALGQQLLPERVLEDQEVADASALGSMSATRGFRAQREGILV